jgi:maltose O-acetyltransferase
VNVTDREGMGGTLTLGVDTAIDESVDIDTSADVTIGDRVALSEGVLILTHDHDPANIREKHASPLSIGEGAWIGARVIILASCDHIGAHAVVGAGSVVTHDIPPRQCWAGNPAHFLRDL